MNTIMDIGAEWVSRCLAKGELVVAGYATGLNPRSKACVVAGREPIYDKPDVQAYGKAAEVAVCKFLDADPERLNWGNYADKGGVDLTLGPFRFDIKGSPNVNASRLIWPESKTHFFDSIEINTFVAVRATELCGMDDTLRYHDVFGWTTKDVFHQCHTTEQSGTRGLVKGTWYMNEPELWPAASLKAAVAIVCGGQ